MGESVARSSPSLRAVASGKEDSDEDGAQESSWAVAAQATGDAGQSQKSRSSIVGLGPGRECRERTNLGSVAARQGGQSARASQPRHHPGRGSRQGGTTPESFGYIACSWRTRGRCHQRVLKKAQEVARERFIAELVRECKDFIERSTRRVTMLKAELESETGMWRRVVFGWRGWKHNRQHKLGNRLRESGARTSTLQQMVNQLQLERDSLSQGKAMVWGRTSRCQCNSSHARSPPRPRGVFNHQKMRVARRTLTRFADVIARLSHLLSQGASQLASIRQGAGAQDPDAMEVQGGPGTWMSALVDAADAKRRCLDGRHGCRVES